MNAAKFTVPVLYRHILKAAMKFPSIKRESIIKEIQTEFREGKKILDSNQIQEKMRIAVRGLEELEQYAQLDQKSKEWNLYLRGMCP